MKCQSRKWALGAVFIAYVDVAHVVGTGSLSTVIPCRVVSVCLASSWALPLERHLCTAVCFVLLDNTNNSPTLTMTSFELSACSISLRLQCRYCCSVSELWGELSLPYTDTARLVQGISLCKAAFLAAVHSQVPTGYANNAVWHD